MTNTEIYFDRLNAAFEPKSGEMLELCLINLPDMDDPKQLNSDQNEVKNEITVELNNPNSGIKIYQIGLANANQSLNTNITVQHNAINCSSEVISHFVLMDEYAQSAWSGNIVINRGAKGTQTFEENRNLLLKKGAKAKSEPNLEIFEGDIIEAKHASASSRFDDEELFYIMSRGIDKESASKLILHAFLNSVIDKMSISDDEKNEIFRKVDKI